jgi:hypothetical protein
VSPETTRAWLFVKGPQSIRIVVDGPSLAVYGPGRRVSHSEFGGEMDATLQQAAVEQSLVRQGWSLEQLTTERRASEGSGPPEVERRRPFRLVHSRV